MKTGNIRKYTTIEYQHFNNFRRYRILNNFAILI
jgi:hypothetical protein